jgi:hypothetical protein
MLSRKLYVLILGVAICGCETIKKEAVYVDISRVAASDVSPVAAAITEDPKRPEILRDQMVYLPGLPAQRIDFPKVQKLLEQAQRDIEQGQHEAFVDLRKNLLRVYETKATVEAGDYRKQAEDTTDELLQQALARLEQAVQAYGEQRGWSVARLAFLQTQDKRRPQIADEIAQLRQKLEELERQFEQQTRDLFADVNAAKDARLTRIEAEVQRILQRWRQKAADDAQAMTKTMARRLNSTLAGMGSVHLPARPGAQLHIEGAPPLEPMPSVPAHDPSANAEARIRHDLAIWLAVTNRESGDESDKDRTQEFIEWRRRHQVGR